MLERFLGFFLGLATGIVLILRSLVAFPSMWRTWKIHQM